jgi:hypothetical protein
MWSAHGLGMGGGMDQLMVQVDEGGSRPCGVEGESLVEVWRAGKVLVALERAPLQKGAPLCQKGAPLWGRVRPCCLLDRQGLNSSPSRRFGDFLLFFHAAKS